ncbi:hypothetical protein SAMD00019534_003150 [Acytostelium subglobosum LB1]|uniref:Polyketide synthase SteelyB n=1 Tax=Acytostelium subglobosum TaxID=361139 RepID=A0A077JCW3_ACYSU|nr:hypothetical protein SAMD00019534_003150 [Acytostelium subglobosum LB1]BAP16677.1 polyketide synthase SteelyB [Acytostelium subglobosum]GAM17140.1 hypothetical protein SAMD00019534_003150 [Acytostelium subglobosum LB1]|eukprot:XP_012759202.1 hypothetical protein SAMD00019534_003150 [Acytostelium subglobosum LB1]
MSRNQQPIAIIGVGCKFPGDITNIDEFWNVVANGGDCLTRIPADRWDADAIAQKEFKLNNRQGGFISDLDKFDPQFFGMSPKEAAQIDPQQRLILQVAMEALEDAKLSFKQVKGTSAGVFIGSSSSDYQRTMGQTEINQFSTQGCNSSFLSNRLSYFLDIAGPSMTVNTACSSSLVAIHLGANSIWRDECKVAIVGGVNVVASPLQSLDYGKAGLLSTEPNGRCYSFDDRASGYVRAEGAGVLILKNLTDAIRDKDEIYSVILNTVTNQNGQTPSGITAPRAIQQEALLCRLLDGANVLPNEIGYFECHGTGTQMGDANELEAIGMSIGAHRETPLPIGSVKSNLGHLEGASGICGLIKTMACLKHKLIAPIAPAGFKNLNPKIPFDTLNLSVPTAVTAWADERRLAIVNSFGVGGSNASILISNYMPKTSSDSSDGEEAAVTSSKHLEVFTVSTNLNDQHALKQRCQDMVDFIEESGEKHSIKDLCYSSTVRTNHLANRVSFLVDSVDDLVAKLKNFVGDANSEDVSNTFQRDDNAANTFDKKKIAFVCSGQGQQWISMGKELFEGNFIFRNEFKKCSSLFHALSGWSIIDKLFDPRNTEAIHDTWLAQPSIFATQVGICAVLKAAGVRPASVIGHSLGEVVAAHVAGVLSLEDSIKLMWTRSHLQNKTTGTGKMCITVSSKEDILALVDKYGLTGKIVIAGNNSSKSVGISGSNAYMDSFMSIMKDEHVAFKPIRINAGFHSYLMDTIKDEFYSTFPRITHNEPLVPFYSTTLGKLIDANNYKHLLNVDYWWSNLRETVMFKEALSELVRLEEFDCYIEVSAHPIISFFVNHMIRERSSNHIIFPTMSRDAPNFTTIMETLSKLYVNGFDINWEALYRRRVHTAIRLPARRWNLDSYWIESNQSIQDRVGLPKRASLSRRLVSATPSFEVSLDSTRFRYLADHKIQNVAIVPYAFFLEVVYSAMDELRAELPSPNFEVSNFEIKTALEIDAKFNNTIQINFNSSLTQFEIASISDPTTVPVKWTVHANGKVVPSANETLPAFAVPSTSGQKVVSGADFYANISKLGYNYGPSFQGLQKYIAIDNHSQVSEIQLPATTDLQLHATQDFALLHPSVLDAVFQSCFAPIEDAKQGLWIPQSFDKLISSTPQQVGDLRATLYSCTTITNHKDKTTFVCDITVTKQNGQVVCQFKNMTMKCIARSASTGAVDAVESVAKLNEQLYSYEWSITSEGQIVKDARFENLIVFTDDESSELTKQLLDTLNKKVINLVIVKQTEESFAVSSAGGAHIINLPLNDNCPKALFAALNSVVNTKNWNTIVLPGFFQSNNATNETTMLVERAYSRLLLLLQEAIACEWTGRFTLVTQGGQSILKSDVLDYTQYSVVGLLRVFTNEYSPLHCSMIDIDHTTDASTLFVELSKSDCSWEVAFRAGKRYTYQLKNQTVLAEDAPSISSNNRSERRYQVEISDNGVISDMAIVETPRHKPRANEVEVKVEITSLNFRDILKTLGRDYDPNHLTTIGDEFAGVITAVGDNVSQFQVGDQVFGMHMARSMCSHITCPTDLVFPMPKGLTAAEATTIPITFLTAWYSIVVQAKLQKGEKILIHSAAGGVGLSAVQIAQYLGAEVFVTVGTKDKRQYLQSTVGIPADHIYNSRNGSFLEEILAATNGQGVDVVLNSLSGELIDKSILALANYGRFVEIGKKDIYSDSKIGLLPFRNNLSYLAVDVAQMTVNRRQYLSKMMLDTLIPLFESKDLKPLPFTAFSISNVVQSVRHMSTGNHIGKNLVSWVELDKATTKDLTLQLNANATYLITGLGGLAMTLAKKLIAMGATELVFASKRGADTMQKQVFLQSIVEKHNISFVVETCDLTSASQVSALVSKYANLKGIFHTAGLLSDRRIVEQTVDSFNTAFHSKATSAINLHNASLNLQLDYFVTIGSAITALGNPGQANYATGNRFVEALTHQRINSGLKASCLHLAPIPEIGMSADEKVTFILSNMGFTPYASLNSMAEGLAQCLSNKSKESVIHYCDFKFAKWLASVPGFRGQSCFSIEETVDIVAEDNETVGADASESSDQSSADIEQSLKEILSNIMEIKIEKIDANSAFKDLGLDSLLASELSNSIHKKFSVFVPSLSLLDPKASISKIISKINPSAGPSAKKTAEDYESEVIKATIESIKPRNRLADQKKAVANALLPKVDTISLAVPTVRVNKAKVIVEKQQIAPPSYFTPLSSAATTPVSPLSPRGNSPTKTISMPPSPKSDSAKPMLPAVDLTPADFATAIYAIEPLSAPYPTTQKHVFDSYKDHTKELTFMTNVYKNCKIKERYMFVDTKDHMTLNAMSTSEKNMMFPTIIHKTIVEAGERIIQKNNVDRSLISHVVGVTSTGILAPSIDATLCRALNLEQTVGRTMINFMGCGAAVIALRTAAVHARNRPGTYVLVMAVESSTTNMDIDPNEKGDIVSGCIFSDGCAAALVTCQPKANLVGKLQVVDDISFLMKDSGDALFMHMGNRGIDLTLRPTLSTAIEKSIKSTMDSFLGGHELEVSDMEFWAVHPGGRKILEAVHQGLNLGAEELAESYEVMKWYGNMVSCSALYVLKRILEKIKVLKIENGKGLQQGVVMAFSPGASIEAMLLRMINAE